MLLAINGQHLMGVVDPWEMPKEIDEDRPGSATRDMETLWEIL
jgi:hypothetical protein